MGIHNTVCICMCTYAFVCLSVFSLYYVFITVCLCLEWIIVGGVLGGLCVVLIVGCVAVKLAQRHRHGYRYSHLQDATLYS